MVVGREVKDGLLTLSKQRVDGIKLWQTIDKSLEEGTAVEGTIVSEVKGGFMVDIGVTAFLPISQVDIKPVKNPASFIGRHLKYKVIKVNQKKANVIVSRRMLIEEEKERKRKEFWNNVKEGQVIYGFVKSITDYGAFIDLGGVDGFLYVNDITWGRITHPEGVPEAGRRGQGQGDGHRPREAQGIGQHQGPEGRPLAHIDEKYPVGSRVKGKAVGVVEYGVFVELEPGLEGLLHVSEMSWDKKVRNPSKLVAKGDMLELQVLDIDMEKKRISLGAEAVEDRPMEGACGEISRPAP